MKYLILGIAYGSILAVYVQMPYSFVNSSIFILGSLIGFIIIIM